MKILHIPKYLGTGMRHGGTRREEQVQELLEEAFPPPHELHTLCILPHRLEWRALAAADIGFYFRLLCIGLPRLLWRGLSLRGAAWLLVYGVAMRRKILRLAPDHVFLEGSYGASLLLAELLGEAGITYSLLPHNIQFMVPEHRDNFFRNGGIAFEWELRAFRGAVRVHCISSLDRQVADCVGARTALLPYYPVRAECGRFAAIRTDRATTPKKHVLVLGTAFNPPTRAGMQRLLREIAAAPGWTAPVVVAGYGTEMLGEPGSAQIRIAGSVPEAELEALLREASFLMVWQPATTGFLTRLIESNLSGIPVVVVGDYAQAAGLEAWGIARVEGLSGLHEGGMPAGGAACFERPGPESLRADPD
ncbi:MAG: hypothetical protein K0S16_710 [Moraxellaceae bacterium]|jgi:hypothetical protein|nr:hypothetical protein [Moraxellaceae bacterium]